MLIQGADLVERREIADLLIAHGASIHAVDPEYPWPAIAYESRGDRGNHPERIQALIDYGADVNAFAAGAKQPYTVPLKQDSLRLSRFCWNTMPTPN